MNDLQTHIFKTYFPYLVCFILGVLVAWQGCGSGETETVTIEKPVPVKTTKETPTKEGRFVTPQPIPVNKPKGVLHVANEPETIINTNTPFAAKFDFSIDTNAIIKAWLFERIHYDTTVEFTSATVRMMWSNYQNVSENLVINYLPKKVVRANFALGVHANAGLISDFQTRYTPLFGLGLQVSFKKNYIAADYGFNGQHYVGVRYGRNIIQR